MEEVVGAEGDDGLAHLVVPVVACVACEFVGAHLCAASCAAWAVSNLARCVPAVSEVVRALCGLVELLGAGNNVAQFRSAALACGVRLLERKVVCACVRLLVRPCGTV